MTTAFLESLRDLLADLGGETRKYIDERVVGPLERRIAELEQRVAAFDQKQFSRYTGTFDPHRSYTVGDLTTDRNCLWHCKNDVRGVRPPAGSWQLVSRPADGRDRGLRLEEPDAR